MKSIRKSFINYWIILFSFVIPAFVFILLCTELLRRNLIVFDNDVYKFISGFISEKMTVLMRFFSFLGSAGALIAIDLLLLVFLYNNKRSSYYSIMLTLNLLITFILSTIFKYLFHRQRPDLHRLVNVSGYSFPSGHSMISMSFYGFLIFIIYISIRNKKRFLPISLLLLLILSIGISRIYLGVHYASDVIAGFSAGSLWLSVFLLLIIRKGSSFI